MNANPKTADEWITLNSNAGQNMRSVQQWLDEGRPLLWMPIMDRENFPDATPEMLALAAASGGLCIVISRAEHFMTLPQGIKGWLLPADAEDTEVVCGRWENAVTFMDMRDRRTGAKVTYRTDNP